VASTAAGCRYCQAHETVDAKMRGVDEEKIAEIWDFERSPRYSDAERAALRFARDASVVPNAVTPEHFEDLRRHWDDGEIVEILAVVGLFGFLNRWNDSMATISRGADHILPAERPARTGGAGEADDVRRADRSRAQMGPTDLLRLRRGAGGVGPGVQLWLVTVRDA
jgi:hypothetical protein